MRFRAFVAEHGSRVITLGAGPGCREVESFLLETFQGMSGRPQIITVDESATMHLARREHTRQDLGTRKAVLLAHRAQDPLTEWARVDPGDVPLGSEMGEVHQGLMLKCLEDVRESCVHAVGVDLLSAPEDILGLARMLPEGHLSAVCRGVLYVLPNLEYFNAKGMAVYGKPVGLELVLWVTLYGLGYIAASMLLSVVVFRRKDLP